MLNQVFGEVGSKDEEHVEEVAEEKNIERDDISEMLSQDSDPEEYTEEDDDEPTEEELEEVFCPDNTDFTKCIGI